MPKTCAQSALLGLTCGHGDQRPQSGLLSQGRDLQLHGQHSTSVQVTATWRTGVASRTSATGSSAASPKRRRSTVAVTPPADDLRRQAPPGWPASTGRPLATAVGATPPGAAGRLHLSSHWQRVMHHDAAAAVPARRRSDAMTSPQDQFADLGHRTQENFKRLWQQWSDRSNELIKKSSSRPATTGSPAGNPEDVLDAVFDFAEQLIAQQRIFAKQMLRAASRGQQPVADAPEATGDSDSPIAPASSPDAASTTRITSADLPPQAFPAGEPER
jgi:hypothetical protein